MICSKTLYKPLIVVLFFAVMLFSYCNVHKGSATTESIVASNPKIIFINYSIKKTSNGVISISLINQIETDGRIKKVQTVKNGEKGDLIYAQIDKNNNILQTEIIKNPFIKVIEYVDETKSLQKKRMDLNSAQLSIRLQLNPSTKYISISTFENNDKPLIKTLVN